MYRSAYVHFYAIWCATVPGGGKRLTDIKNGVVNFTRLVAQSVQVRPVESSHARQKAPIQRPNCEKKDRDIMTMHTCRQNCERARREKRSLHFVETEQARFLLHRHTPPQRLFQTDLRRGEPLSKHLLL